ncbi:MAG: hypothetical protein KUG76_06685 [Gammaproteobacteria bacterium]|nr:hypothetical protein [Gammaproteobacteria bacterium]
MIAKFFAFFSITYLALVCELAFGLSVIDRNLDQLLGKSDEVVYGVVTNISSRYGSGRSSEQIYTYVDLSEVVSLKRPREYDGTVFTLRIAGGRVGNRMQVIPGSPEFKLNTRYILFVKGNNQVSFPLVGINQGVLPAIFDTSMNDYRIVFDKRTERIFSALSSETSPKVNRSIKPFSARLSAEALMQLLSVKWQLRHSEEGQ